MRHIGDLIAAVSAELCLKYAMAARHDLKCPYWDRIEPTDCDCRCRPMIDLLLHIAARKAE